MFPQDKDILLQTVYYEDNSSLQDIPLELLCLIRNNNLLDMTCKYHFPVDLDMCLLDKRLDSLIPLDNMNLLDIPMCHHQLDSLFHLDNNTLPNIYESPTLYHSKDNNILSHMMDTLILMSNPKHLSLCLEDIEEEMMSLLDNNDLEDKHHSLQSYSHSHMSHQHNSHGMDHCHEELILTIPNHNNNLQCSDRMY